MPKKRKRVVRKAASTRDRKDKGVSSSAEVSVVPLAKLTPLADNPRSHTTRGIDFIAASLDRVGATRSGVIDEKRLILAGNGMREAAVQAGYRDAIVVRVDGTRPVFVQRANLSAPQKTRVIIDDNRASELSSWNAKLLDYAERDLSIKAEWTAPEWRAAVGPRPVTEGRTDPDATVAPRSTTIVRGDQFQLGAHLCIVKTAPATKSRTYAPLEFRAEDGETPPLCSTLLSSSSHLASVPFGRCVGAAPTWCWRTSLCGSK